MRNSHIKIVSLRKNINVSMRKGGSEIRDQFVKNMSLKILSRLKIFKQARFNSTKTVHINESQKTQVRGLFLLNYNFLLENMNE